MCGVKGRRFIVLYLNNIRSVGSWKCLYDHWLANKAYFSISQWKTFIGVLPSRWRRKPAGIEITSLTPYVYGNARLTAKMYRVLRLCSSWTPRLDFYWCLALLVDGETATNEKRMVQRARERESREYSCGSVDGSIDTPWVCFMAWPEQRVAVAATWKSVQR